MSDFATALFTYTKAAGWFRQPIVDLFNERQRHAEDLLRLAGPVRDRKKNVVGYQDKKMLARALWEHQWAYRLTR